MKLINIFLISLCFLTFSYSSFGLSLEEAKSKGIVGEQQNGYLAAIGTPSGEVQSLVSSINEQRKAKYFEIANKNGTTLAAVEALAGKKAIEESPAGRYVQSSSGQWEKK